MTSVPFKVLHMLPDLAVGGGQVLLLHNLRLLTQDSGWRHLVCAAQGGPMEADFRSAGITTKVLGLAGPSSLPGVLARLVQFGSRHGVHLIHSNNTRVDRLLGQIAALALGVPVVNSFHAIAPREDCGSRGFRFRRRLVRLANRGLVRLNIARLIAVSDAVRCSHAAWLGLPPERFDVIHNGLPPAAFDLPAADGLHAQLRRDLDFEDCYPVILCLGRLEAAKGQRTLVAAMSELRARWPNACLLLAGDGQDRAVLRDDIARGGIGSHVRLLGERKDVPLLLAAADLLVSASRIEGFGLAVLEAMAAGLPVIALFTPAIAEFLEDGRSGLFVRDAEPQTFADAIDDLAADPDRAARLGTAARQRARQFSAVSTARNMTAVYRSVLGLDPAPAWEWP